MEREKPECCDFCEYETDHLKWYLQGQGGWLCYVCSHTPAGTVALHPGAHQAVDVDVLRTVVLTTHMILDALAKKKMTL